MMAAVAVGLVMAGTAWAGSLSPPGAPSPTMHSLEEIYQQLLATQQQVDDLDAVGVELVGRCGIDLV